MMFFFVLCGSVFELIFIFVYAIMVLEKVEAVWSAVLNSVDHIPDHRQLWSTRKQQIQDHPKRICCGAETAIKSHLWRRGYFLPSSGA